jgi:hypothetical protein
MIWPRVCPEAATAGSTHRATACRWRHVTEGHRVASCDRGRVYMPARIPRRRVLAICGPTRKPAQPPGGSGFWGAPATPACDRRGGRLARNIPPGPPRWQPRWRARDRSPEWRRPGPPWRDPGAVYAVSVGFVPFTAAVAPTIPMTVPAFSAVTSRQFGGNRSPRDDDCCGVGSGGVGVGLSDIRPV